AGGKTIVFGILRRQGKVYTEIVPAASKKQLQGAIRGKVGLA
ncbi:MAG: Transposase, partial [Olavius algarvensis Gamma 1 endosymbiont]